MLTVEEGVGRNSCAAGHLLGRTGPSQEQPVHWGFALAGPVLWDFREKDQGLSDQHKRSVASATGCTTEYV